MKRLKLNLLIATTLAGMTIAAPNAQAVTFNLTDLGGAKIGTLARQGFEIATKYWSSVLTDNVTMNLEIGFSKLGTNILGSTGSNSQVAYASDVYNAMGADATSILDGVAGYNLPALRGTDLAFNVRVNDYNSPVAPVGSIFDGLDFPESGYSDERTRLDNDRSANNYVLDVNTANLKALGFTEDANGDPIDTTYDGTVTFNSDFASVFDFNPSDGIGTGKIDFIGTAIHEIGHALGFVSGVDTYDYFTAPGSPVIGTFFGFPITAEEALRLGLLQDGVYNLEGFAVGSPLDLFRYNPDGELDWSTSDALKMFSVDGGVSQVYGKGAFSLGAFNGDGNQASHWLQPEDQSTRDGACSNFLGIMNPYICGGKGDAITSLDLAAMDVIGWDLASDVRDDPNYSFSTSDAYLAFVGSVAAVPEPATWMQMILGMGAIGALIRRRRQVPALA